MNEKQKLTSEIMTLTYMINETTEYCAFIRFSGHVDDVEIDIAKSKKDYLKSIVSSGFETKGSIERLQSVKETLLEILKDKNIDVSNFDYEIEEIRHYKF
jgi:acid stress-induced BolA-like protein IbaG/YrbA